MRNKVGSKRRWTGTPKQKEYYRKVIVQAKGDRNLAARELGISRSTFFRRATILGLVKPRTDPSLEGILSYSEKITLLIEENKRLKQVIAELYLKSKKMI